MDVSREETSWGNSRGGISAGVIEEMDGGYWETI